ncbi:phosphoglucosamine mutase [Paraphotobacterium marinum]|uniref:Phosphoglucosamine mutase n=1 Tax=Paraphotobacterium marinum TaxID=1755811 RepID=A0A220VDA2_9GAMM|nr:phosphoglucosamine mutase [Paraphotobacterium marinum]ASK78374.1 phosphoglucosamine mutase [Paraphotobacterium marinum]
MSERKYFGTDGVRGLVGSFPIQPDFVLKLGWAAGKVLAKNGTKKVIIGKDTRISGYMLESALEAGFAAAGLQSILTGPMPTPAISYLTQTFRAEAGVVISASHNPYQDNGIKFFSNNGFKLPDHIEKQIENELTKDIICVEAHKFGKAIRIDDAAGRYIEFTKGTFPSELSLAGLNIVLDCANGATYDIAPKVFSELGANTKVIGCSPNGVNINEGYGATDTANLRAEVLKTKSHLGIAFDGDGDRVIMVDEDGFEIDGDKIAFILAKHYKNTGIMNNSGVVGTLMSNLGLEKSLSELGVEFIRAKVGDRYVHEKMKENNWILGAENSGHVIISNKAKTGDGIVAALQVLRVIIESGKSLKDLASDMQVFPQVLKNIKLSEGDNPLGDKDNQNFISNIEKKLGNKGRILIRKSGTEPLLRVMVEGESKSFIEKIATEIVERLKSKQ